MKIRLKQVTEAIEMADDAYTAFWDRQTGETVFLDDPDSIMESFVEELPPGNAQNELAGAIRNREAFRRFKNGIRYFGIEQQWYDYLAEAYRETAIRWCRDNGLEYEDEEARDCLLYTSRCV